MFGHRDGDLTLNGEDILQLAIVRFGPDGTAIGGIDQLGDDAHAVALSAHAPFEQVRYSQLLTNGPAVVGLSLKKKRRAAADDLEPRNFGENRDQLFREAVREIVIAWVAAGVDQRQHRDAFLGHPSSIARLVSGFLVGRATKKLKSEQTCRDNCKPDR